MKKERVRMIRELRLGIISIRGAEALELSPNKIGKKRNKTNI